MPFESKSQQRWMFANEPAMAKRWASHTPNIKSLPEKKKPAGKLGAKAASLVGYLNADGQTQEKELMTADKVAQALDQLPPAVQALFYKKAQDKQRKDAVTLMTGYIDKVASDMPLERTTPFRMIQVELSRGIPLGQAIKIAFPTVNPETRGILASRLCDEALKWAQKEATLSASGAPMKTVRRQEFNGPAGAAQAELRKMAAAA